MTKISIFGMGSFGTALANVLAENGHDVLMWGKNEQNVNNLNEHHMNPQYLKEAKLCDSIKATTDINQAIQFSDVFLMALPTKAMREVAGEIDQHLSSKKNIYSCRKRN